LIPCPILPEQIDAVGRLGWCPCPHWSRGLGEGFHLGTQGPLQDGAVLGLGGAPDPRGALLESLSETIVETPDDELAHNTLRPAIIE
jgi:hypothetical protein